jgi:amidohydrolase
MGKTTLEWSQEVDRRLEQMVALRRDFHRHPELSLQEHRTAQIIAERLHAAGLEVRTNIGGSTAVMGILHGDRPGRTIAWRADIDALPLTELLQAPFASGTPGVMHACGHDGHTAIAITLAEILAARRAEVPGTAVLLFQPAEEVFGGAKPMIASRGVGAATGRGNLRLAPDHADTRGPRQHPSRPLDGFSRLLRY